MMLVARGKAREKQVASRRKNRYGEARFLYLSEELGDDFSRHLLPLRYVYLYESLILSLQCARRTYGDTRARLLLLDP